MAVLLSFSALHAIAVLADPPDLTDLDLDTLMKMDVVVVTAQKREQNLQEVGTSITAFDSATITRMGFSGVTDIAKQTPGLQFNQYSPTITALNIRGVSQNDYADHQEAPVALYWDETYIASMGAVAGLLFDLQRIEVLRGPQGTLFGRNATGGLVHLISQRPTDTPEAYLRITGGRFAQLMTEGALNGPVGGRVSGRLSFATAHHDALMSNRAGRDTANRKEYATRLQFLLKPTADGEFLLKLYGLRNDRERSGASSWAAAFPGANGLGTRVGPGENPWGTCNGCDMLGYRNPTRDVFNQAYDRADGGLFDRALHGVTGRLGWTFGETTLTSITDYQRLRKRYGDDTDASPNPILLYDSNQIHRQFSQELRLNGTRGALQWIAGVYYLDMNSNNEASNEFLGDAAYDISRIRTRTWAGFAQGEWRINPRWAAILGARYTHDRKTDDQFSAAPTPQDVLSRFNPQLNPDLARLTADLPGAKLEINHRLGHQLLYGSVNLGSKSGGFMQSAAVVENMVYEPERLLSYELGIKTLFWRNRVRLNAAAFYYDYDDYQAFEATQYPFVMRNRQARVLGGEAELAITPLDGLKVQLGVSTLDSVVRNVGLLSGAVVERQMPLAPKWSVNGLARYEWPALGSVWSAQIDASYVGDMYFTALNAPVDLEPAHATANVRLGYASADGRIEAAVFCKNATDSRYRVYNADISLVGISSEVYAPPRWYGLSVTYHWQ